MTKLGAHERAEGREPWRCDRYTPAMSAASEIEDVLSEMTTLLKNPEVSGLLNERQVNTSVALALVDALDLYLHGKKSEAASEFAELAHEIRERLRLAKTDVS
jgi:hypothetical protein